MVERILTLPNKSFLLFGPRGVGKSTLLKRKINAALTVNLLKSSDFLMFTQNPDHLIELTKPLKKGDWVVIDEVQRIPELLNIVHEIYESKNIHFALSGSSARKLKRGGANLLAGRALQTFLYPFAFPEFKNLSSLKDAIEWGTLPSIVTEPEFRTETLATYVETYLREELVQEGIIRNTDSFIRFLKVAGIMNGQSLNYENISRESHTSRTTVQTYFEILSDTLIGFYLPSYQPGLKVKEVSKPKFYFFDSGVARACAGLISYQLDSNYKGYLFETLMVNQIKSYNEYSKKRLGIYFYGIAGGSEVDLVIEQKIRTHNAPAEVIAIEFKLGDKWKNEWKKNISVLSESAKIKISKKYIVYTGERNFETDDIYVVSAERFLELLFEGNIF
ncbi:MAG: ATP-binding protein [Bdellovibrio sp.]